MNLASALDDSGQTNARDRRVQRIGSDFRPNDAQAHYNLAISLGKQQVQTSSLSELREAAKLEPTWPVPHIWLVTLLMDPTAGGPGGVPDKPTASRVILRCTTSVRSLRQK